MIYTDTVIFSVLPAWVDNFQPKRALKPLLNHLFKPLSAAVLVCTWWTRVLVSYSISIQSFSCFLISELQLFTKSLQVISYHRCNPCFESRVTLPLFTVHTTYNYATLGCTAKNLSLINRPICYCSRLAKSVGSRTSRICSGCVFSNILIIGWSTFTLGFC